MVGAHGHVELAIHELRLGFFSTIGHFQSSTVSHNIEAAEGTVRVTDHERKPAIAFGVLHQARVGNLRRSGNRARDMLGSD